MLIKKIVVIYKKSNLENLKNSGLWNKIKETKFPLLEKIILAHEKHRTSIQNLKKILKDQNIFYEFYDRNDSFLVKGDTNLLVSLGGDGTFIHCAHYNLDIPLLGINSAPGDSVGHYCKFSIPDDLDQIQSFFRSVSKEIPQPKKIDCLQAYLNNKPINIPILNDALITEASPAEVSSYLIDYSQKTEWHKSSGVWITTHSGSTAAYHSAGGRPFHLYNQEKKRQYGFWVRELYGKDNTLQNGLICEESNFRIISNMLNGMIYIDGFRIKFNFLLGSVLNFKFHNQPLLAYI